MSDVREFELRQLAVSGSSSLYTHSVFQYRYKTPGATYFDPVPRSIPDSYTEWKNVPVVYTSLNKEIV